MKPQDQRSKEELIKEILSKLCPFHGLRANIEFDANWEITVSTCCGEFHELISKIIHKKQGQ